MVNVSHIGDIRIKTSPAKLGGWMGGEFSGFKVMHTASSFSLHNGASSKETVAPELLLCFANSLFFGSIEGKNKMEFTR